MKHLHFVQSLEPLQGGGLGGAALGLHLAQLEGGHESTLVATREAGFQGHWREVHQLPRSGLQKAFFARNLKPLAAKAVSASNIVHSHGFYTYLNWVFGAEARRAGKPLVCHVQGFFDPWILSRSKVKKKAAHLLFEDANFRHTRLWRALTRKEEAQIRAQGIRDDIVVAANGVDLTSIDDLGRGGCDLPHMKRSREKRLLFLGRLHRKKGLDLLIPAWAALCTEYPDWELAIVGPDEGGFQQHVEMLIAKYNVRECCEVFPAVTGAEKNTVLRSADLFVLPSYSEGFPVAVLEAAASGVPVVLTDECNFPELRENGAAWECRPSIDSLLNSLREALNSSDSERQERGAAGRKLVEQAYTWQQITKRINEACATLV